MDQANAKITEQTLGLPGISYPRISQETKDFLYRAKLLLYGAILVFFIILLKSKTTDDFRVEPYLFSYAIFVTTFIISRIVAALLYESSMSSLKNDIHPDFRKYSEHYEPTVTFVIPCLNEERDIADSVSNCYQIDYPKEKIEVIVINDGSTDNTLSILRQLQETYPNLKVIDWPNQGKRWAMAAGFKVSTSEIIIQLDSDSEIDPKTFQEWIEPFKNPAVAAVCAHGVPKNADKNVITRMQSAYYFMSFRILKSG